MKTSSMLQEFPKSVIVEALATALAELRDRRDCWPFDYEEAKVRRASPVSGCYVSPSYNDESKHRAMASFNSGIGLLQGMLLMANRCKGDTLFMTAEEIAPFATFIKE